LPHATPSSSAATPQIAGLRLSDGARSAGGGVDMLEVAETPSGPWWWWNRVAPVRMRGHEPGGPGRSRGKVEKEREREREKARACVYVGAVQYSVRGVGAGRSSLCIRIPIMAPVS